MTTLIFRERPFHIKAEWNNEYSGFINTLPCGCRYLTDGIPENWRTRWWIDDHKRCNKWKQR